MRFEERRQEYVRLIELALDRAIPQPNQNWPEQGIPQMMTEAMRYSLLAGGKRLRPMLLLGAYNLLADGVEPALPFAVAIEMVHTYSLIHDDLPAMDNDDLRRGKPTNHKVYGEAMAILAGDSLLNMAYELMAQSEHPQALKALAAVAGHSGASGMIAGQTADIWVQDKQVDEDMLLYIHRHKTADLMTAPIVCGLLLAGADEQQLDQGRQYGYHMGMAFQIVDDILDELGDEASMGKRLQKDQSKGKLTWPGVFGLERAKEQAREHIDQAILAVNSFGTSGEFLSALAQTSLKRVV